MKQIAYVQKVKGEFGNINFFNAYLGLSRFYGFQVLFFETFDEIKDKVTKETVVYGGIGIMNQVFKHLGVNPEVPYWPVELQPFLGRKMWDLTVNEVHARVEAGESFFVKPTYADKKKFTGRVMTKFIDLLHLHFMGGEEIVHCSLF